MIPTFAVVGHPNKGKSSIVATLAEDERVAIGTTPGTTRRAHSHTFVIDNLPQYVLVDTPGFQRARAVLEWLEARVESASQRPGLVAEFVREHGNDERFRDECELLAPIIAGAGILYVVDGAKPYGKEYELEMEILQWTGRPRMALINMIGPGDYKDEWRHALDQYFSIVREFDAMNADFANRISLLRAFAELDESWRGALERAVLALTEERARRQARSAGTIADELFDCLTCIERLPLAEDELADAHKAELVASLEQRIMRREQQARQTVEAIYRWEALTRQEAAQQLLGTSLFSAEGWELFGLSNGKLIVSGALTGAVAGSGVDVLLGGASFLLGAGIGALLGGAGAWLGGQELAKVKVLGETLGGRVLTVGPVSDPSFPWVLLGRAWVHHHLVSERNHARREALSVALAADLHLMDLLPDELRRDLGRLFARISRTPAGGYPQLRSQLTDAIDSVLAQPLPTQPASSIG